MTAKDKAKEFVDKYRSIEFNVLHTDCEGDRAVATGICTTVGAKQCAIICVDEIINSDPSSPYGDGFYELHSDRIEDVKIYWEQVKQAINEL